MPGIFVTDHCATATGIEGGVLDHTDAGKSVPLTLEPVLVDQARARMICGGVSSATWQRLKSADKIPAHVRVGGRVFFRVDDLRLWIKLGCPDRRTFESRRAI
jgi:hypothetical protein